MPFLVVFKLTLVKYTTRLKIGSSENVKWCLAKGRLVHLVGSAHACTLLSNYMIRLTNAYFWKNISNISLGTTWNQLCLQEQLLVNTGLLAGFYLMCIWMVRTCEMRPSKL